MALNQQLASVKGEVHAARDEQIRAAHRLEQLQAKLVHGGENLLDKSARLAAEDGLAPGSDARAVGGTLRTLLRFPLPETDESGEPSVLPLLRPPQIQW